MTAQARLGSKYRMYRKQFKTVYDDVTVVCTQKVLWSGNYLHHLKLR